MTKLLNDEVIEKAKIETRSVIKDRFASPTPGTERVLDPETGQEKVVISHRLRAMAYLAAMGFSNKEIAQQLGVSTARVGTVMAAQSMKEEVTRIQEEMFVKDTNKMFMQILPKAASTAYQVMMDSKTKDAVKVDTAFKFMERALGKPVQEIKNDTSELKSLLSRLDSMSKPKTIDIKNDLQDAVIVPEKTEVELDPPKDAVDRWVDENL